MRPSRRVSHRLDDCAGTGTVANSGLRTTESRTVRADDAEATELVEEHLRKGSFSARGYDRVRRIARTDCGPRVGERSASSSIMCMEALMLRARRNLLLGERPVIPGGDAEAYVAALAGLPGMSSSRLSKLLDGMPLTALAWQRESRQAPADPGRRFLRSARATDVAEVAARYRRAGAGSCSAGRAAIRPRSSGDPRHLRSCSPPASPPCSARPRPSPSSGPAPRRPTGAESQPRSVWHSPRRAWSSSRASHVGIDGAAHTGALRASGPTAARPPQSSAPGSMWCIRHRALISGTEWRAGS